MRRPPKKYGSAPGMRRRSSICQRARAAHPEEVEQARVDAAQPERRVGDDREDRDDDRAQHQRDPRVLDPDDDQRRDRDDRRHLQQDRVGKEARLDPAGSARTAARSRRPRTMAMRQRGERDAERDAERVEQQRAVGDERLRMTAAATARGTPARRSATTSACHSGERASAATATGAATRSARAAALRPVVTRGPSPDTRADASATRVDSARTMRANARTAAKRLVARIRLVDRDVGDHAPGPRAPSRRRASTGTPLRGCCA